MIFKFSMDDSFAEAEDRVGVIEAASIQEAAQHLIKWNEGAYPFADDDKITGQEVLYRDNHALVRYYLENLDGYSGADTYHIEMVEGPIFSIVTSDWRLYFTYFGEGGVR